MRGAERVHLVLLDDAVVDDTIDALMDALAPGAVVVDHSTTQPQRTAARAKRLGDQGIAFLHAPVFMSPAAARDAKGIMLVAGPAERFARVKPALAAMTADLWYAGERADLAAGYKLFGNAMILAMAGALADVMHMGDALGIPRRDALGVFDRFHVGGVLQVRGAKILNEDYAPSFALDVARKDVRLMLESAGSEPTPILQALAARMDELIAAGHGGDDIAALARRGT